MTAQTEAVFSIDTVAKYLYSLKEGISPLKLQKTLYFLFAYHGAVYRKKIEDGVFEGTHGTSKYLFNAEFEAWKYGPVIREVYAKDKNNEYSNPMEFAEAVFEIEKEPELKKFIDELFEQIDSVSDFRLVDRSHEDECWKEAYERGQSSEMDNDKIIEEYINRYV